MDDSQIVGVGVALPGPIDRRSGKIGSEVILPDWAGVQAQRELSRRLERHVEVDNDANLGALAEASFGAGRGLENIVYLMLGSGIGAGLVLDGRVHRGAAGLAGELGHVQVRTDGAVCRCGNRGCLETVAGERALAALLRPRLGRDVTVRDLIELIDTGDLGATRLVNDAGRAIGRVLADLCNALNPEAIIVGGELSRSGDAAARGDPRVGRPLRAAVCGAGRRRPARRARRPRGGHRRARARHCQHRGPELADDPCDRRPRARRAGEGGACRVDIGFRHVRRSNQHRQNRRREREACFSHDDRARGGRIRRRRDRGCG